MPLLYAGYYCQREEFLDGCLSRGSNPVNRHLWFCSWLECHESRLFVWSLGAALFIIVILGDGYTRYQVQQVRWKMGVPPLFTCFRCVVAKLLYRAHRAILRRRGRRTISCDKGFSVVFCHLLPWQRRRIIKMPFACGTINSVGYRIELSIYRNIEVPVYRHTYVVFCMSYTYRIELNSRSISN